MTSSISGTEAREGEEPSSGVQRMTEDAGVLSCVHCGRQIARGEPYLPAGRCAMGGVVTGSSVVLYGDVLEPAGEHLRCAADESR